MKSNIYPAAAVKLNQFANYFLIVEVGKSAGGEFTCCLDARVFIKTIIIAQIIFIQQQVNLFAAIAAKYLIIGLKKVSALFATMITGCFYFGRIYNDGDFFKKIATA